MLQVRCHKFMSMVQWETMQKMNHIQSISSHQIVAAKHIDRQHIVC